MGIYSTYEVYPSEVNTNCEHCDFECGTIGYCLKDCGENYIVCSLLVAKGYVQANIDFGFIDGKYAPGIELYHRQCGKFIENMERLGHKCQLYHHPMGKKYLSTVIVDGGVEPIDLALDFLQLDVVK